MLIPKNRKTGEMTLSATQFRTYGAGGLTLVDHEDDKGCPRLYEAKYVSGTVPPQRKSYELGYGSFFHDVMFRMEEHGETPDQSIERAFDPVHMPAEFIAEARADLDRYMERGDSPADLYGMLAVEQDLSALLYVDEEYGPVYFRGLIDWLAVDLEVENVLHLGDYKTNRQPPRKENLFGDLQLRGYAWLVSQLWKRWVPREPRLIVHLDVVKFRSIPIEYTEGDLEDWHAWAVAVARKILRDEEALPVLNPGCGFCPIREACPAYESLPELGAEIATASESFATDAQKIAWRDEANRIRLLLSKGVASVDDEMKERAMTGGTFTVGSTTYARVPNNVVEVDLPALHAAMGDAFYGAVKTSKAAITRATKGWPTERYGKVQSAMREEQDGLKVVRQDMGGE